MHSISRLMARMVTAAVALTSVLCCSKEEGPAYPYNANFRLTFAVPVESKAYGTAGYGDPLNNEGTDNKLTLNDLEVYFFKPDGSFACVVDDMKDIKLTPNTSAGYDPHYHLYDAVMHVDGIANDSWYRVVAVANRRTTHSAYSPFCCPKTDNWLTAGTGSTDEEKLYSTLQFNYANVGATGINHYIGLNFGLDDRAYVPMWGVSLVKTLTKNAVEEGVAPEGIPLSGTVEMLRAVAKVRIDIAPDLLQAVAPTAFDALNGKGGIRLYNPVQTGFMTPPYAHVSGLSSTPDILNKDRVGGSPTAAFTNAWINAGSSAGTAAVYPFYQRGGSYYTYLPEAAIGQCWMGLEFQWKDPAFAKPITHEYKLQFADYEKASADLLAGKDIPLTEAQLEPYRFPVMRNHYYIYTVTKLDPFMIRYEVCDWAERTAPDIIFN